MRAAINGVSLRPMSPPERRTGQPVQGGSRYAGGERRCHFVLDEIGRIGAAMAKLAGELAPKGKRRGGEGTIGFPTEKLFCWLLRRAATLDGYLADSIAWMAREIGVGATSVKKAIRVLEELGLLEHDRRCEPRLDGEGRILQGVRGPQVRQIPNFYRLKIVGRLAQILGAWRRSQARTFEEMVADDICKRAGVQAAVRAFIAGREGALDRVETRLAPPASDQREVT